MNCPHCGKPLIKGEATIKLTEREYHLNCIIEHLKGRKKDEPSDSTRRGAEGDEGRTLHPANAAFD